jgi:phosphoribosylaminoimidazole carboxylase (NCAIR synthetase)
MAHVAIILGCGQLAAMAVIAARRGPRPLATFAFPVAADSARHHDASDVASRSEDHANA